MQLFRVCQNWIDIKPRLPAIALQEFHNKESSEIAVVQALLATLKLQSVLFTFDSLTVSVFDDLTGISAQWLGLASLVQVERIGTPAGKPYHQIAYYISSLTLNATQFAQGIRGHWGIENRLHWVKDVVLKEDSSKMRLGNAPANLSIIRSFAISFAGALRAIAILRYNGYSSITTAVRMIGHNKRADFQLIANVTHEA